MSTFAKRSALKPAVSLTLKKKPSPLSVPPQRCSPPLSSPTGKVGSPRHDQSLSPAGPALVQRRSSLTQLRSPQSQHGPQALSVAQAPLSATRLLPPLSLMSPRHSTHSPLSRRPSHAQLSQVDHSHSQSPSHAPPILPSLIPVRSVIKPVTPTSHQVHYERHHTTLIINSSQKEPILTCRSSYAELPQVPSWKRSGTVVGPLVHQTSNLSTGFGAEMPGNSGLILGVSSSGSRGGPGGALGGVVLRFEAKIDDHDCQQWTVFFYLTFLFFLTNIKHQRL